MRVDGFVIVKPASLVDPDQGIQVDTPKETWVSRGAHKLLGGLESFSLDPADKVCVDVGASTGGFTQVLLRRGARRVYAVDVGYGQLAWELRQDPRVVVMERCNIRHLTADRLETTPSFFTVDCSFISLRLVLPALMPLLTPNPSGVALVKPQFEAGRDQVGKGGVVRDESVRARVVDDARLLARALGFSEIDVIPSPLPGPAGNREFLAYLHGHTG